MAIKTYPKGSDVKLSENFRACEFDCSCARCKQTKIDGDLVDYLQQIRDHFGKPIGGSRLTAYRCPDHNAEVANASKTSRHTQGTAADISIEGVEPAEIAKFAESIGVKGIGLYDTDKDGHFVHIDTRTTKSFWFGHAQQKRTTFGGAPVYDLEQFVRDVQSAVGAAVDGQAGPETLGKTPTIGASFNRHHGVVKAVQQRLLALDYEEVGTADGIAGLRFASALAHFQQDNDCTPTGIAEAWGKTWQKLLGMA